MTTIRLPITLMAMGLFLFAAQVASADSHGSGGGSGGTNATSTNPGTTAITTTPGTDGGGTDGTTATTTTPDAGTGGGGSDGANATSTDPGTTATTTASGADGDGDGYEGGRKAYVGRIASFATSPVAATIVATPTVATTTAATTTVATTPTVTSITLEEKGTGEQVTIGLGGDVQLKFPGGPSNSWETLEDAIAGGAEFVILTEPGEAGNYAVFVLAKPKSVIHKPYVGPVVEAEGEAITILLANGKTKTFKKPRGQAGPPVGEIVTAFVGPEEEGDGEGDTDEPPVSTGLVEASSVSLRLERFVQKLADKEEKLPQSAIKNRNRLISNLASLLDGHNSQQVEILDDAGDNPDLSDAAQAGVQRSLGKAKQGRARGHAVAAEARSRTGAPSDADPDIFGPTKLGKGPKSGGLESGDGGDDEEPADDDEPTDRGQGNGREGPPEDKPGRGNQGNR